MAWGEVGIFLIVIAIRWSLWKHIRDELNVDNVQVFNRSSILFIFRVISIYFFLLGLEDLICGFSCVFVIVALGLG